MKRKHKKWLHIAAELYLIMIGIILLRDVIVSSPTNAPMLIIAAILCIITGMIYMAGTFGIKIKSMTGKRMMYHLKQYIKNRTTDKETKEPLKIPSKSQHKKGTSKSEISGERKVKNMNLSSAAEKEEDYEEWIGVQEDSLKDNSAKDNVEPVTIDFTENVKKNKNPQIRELKQETFDRTEGMKKKKGKPEFSDSAEQIISEPKSSDSTEQIISEPESLGSTEQIIPDTEPANLAKQRTTNQESADLTEEPFEEIPKKVINHYPETDNIEELEKLAETKILESLDELLSAEIEIYEEDSSEPEDDKLITDGEEWEEL